MQQPYEPTAPPYSGAPTTPPYGGAPMAPPPAAGGGSGGGMGKWLSVLAVILAALALVLSVVIPGPTGATGAPGADGTNGSNGTNGINGATGPRGLTGPQGPPGNGTLMVSSRTGATTTLQTTCTNYASGSITIVAPSNGTVVVTAQVWVQIDHTAGTRDLGYVMLGTTDTDCSASGSYMWPAEVPASVGTANPINLGASVQRPFVATTGSHTYYLNGYMASGQSAGDHFWFANMVAVFYPA